MKKYDYSLRQEGPQTFASEEDDWRDYMAEELRRDEAEDTLERIMAECERRDKEIEEENISDDDPYPLTEEEVTEYYGALLELFRQAGSFNKVAGALSGAAIIEDPERPSETKAKTTKVVRGYGLGEGTLDSIRDSAVIFIEDELDYKTYRVGLEQSWKFLKPRSMFQIFLFSKFRERWKGIIQRRLNKRDLRSQELISIAEILADFLRWETESLEDPKVPKREKERIKKEKYERIWRRIPKGG